MKDYFFWRSPDGKPYRGKDGRHAPVTLIRELGVRATVTKAGEVSYTGFMPTMYELAVSSTAAIIDSDGEELGEADTESIVHRALTHAVKVAGSSQPADANEVRREGNRLAAEYYKRPKEKYVLITSLSVDSLPSKRITMGECRIQPISRRNRKFAYPSSISNNSGAEAYRKHAEHTMYQLIRVHTSGRCHHEAVDNALTAVHLLRGLWTLFATYGQSSISFGVRRHIPLGVIHTGPLHALRSPDGTAVSDAVWYDPDYVEDQKLFSPRNGWDRIEKNRKWALRRLSVLPYARELEQLIIRYVAALDHANLDVAFLHLWSLLEKLTGTIGTDYGETIRRATRPFNNRESCNEQLTALRLRRNQFVHSVPRAENREQIVYLIKSFVEPHLVSLLRNDFDVSSMEEFIDYLRLPIDLATLKKRHSQIGRMLRIQRNREAKASKNVAQE